MSDQEPRSYEKPTLGPPEYEASLFLGDEGKWTIVRIQKEVVGQAYSEFDAKWLIEKLRLADAAADSEEKP